MKVRVVLSIEVDPGNWDLAFGTGTRAKDIANDAHLRPGIAAPQGQGAGFVPNLVTCDNVDDVRCQAAKAIGMNRWPSRHWKVNVAWIAVVVLAATLLATFRHLRLPDGDLRKASIKTLRFRLFEVPARITYGQRKTWLHRAAGWAWTPILTTAWQTIKTLTIPI